MKEIRQWIVVRRSNHAGEFIKRFVDYELGDSLWSHSVSGRYVHSIQAVVGR